MKSTTMTKQMVRLIIVLGGALTVLVLAMAPILAASQPAPSPPEPVVIAEPAQPMPPVQKHSEDAPARPAADAVIDVTVEVETTSDPTNGAIVKNGDKIIYTIKATNQVPIERTVDEVYVDMLPSGVTNPKCISANCIVDSKPDDQEILIPGSGVITDNLELEDRLRTVPITVFQKVRTITSVLLKPGDPPVELKFEAEFDSCDPDETQIQITGNVTYQNSVNTSEPSDFTTVQVDPPDLSNIGQSFFDPFPSGCSVEPLGYDQDWGDYDRDGDLDLALGTGNGTSIYKNENGQFSRVHNSSHRTFGVRWGNLDVSNQQLELVSVGDSDSSVSVARDYVGKNYIYTYISNTETFSETPFTTPEVIWRISLADADKNDGSKLEMAAASYFSPDSAELRRHNVCLLRLYQSNGGGGFDSNPDCLIGPLHHQGRPFDPSKNTTSLAWNDDVNRLAVGNELQQNDLCHWSGDAPDCTPLWGGTISRTQDVLWVDYNQDGKPDLLDVVSDTFSAIYKNTGTLDNPQFGVNPDPESGPISSGYSADWVDDRGADASIPTSEDRSLIYSLPDTFNFVYFGRTITKICVTTNGVIELLEEDEQCHPGIEQKYGPPPGDMKDDLDIIYAGAGELRTGVIVERLPPINSTRVEITWIGNLITDTYPFNESVMFKVILFQDGSVQWKFFEMNDTAKDFYSGLYVQEGVTRWLPVPGDSASKTAYKATPASVTFSANITWPVTINWQGFNPELNITVNNINQGYTNDVTVVQTSPVVLPPQEVTVTDTISDQSPINITKPLAQSKIVNGQPTIVPITFDQPYTGPDFVIPVTLLASPINFTSTITATNGSNSHTWTYTDTGQLSAASGWITVTVGSGVTGTTTSLLTDTTLGPSVTPIMTTLNHTDPGALTYTEIITSSDWLTGWHSMPLDSYSSYTEYTLPFNFSYFGRNITSFCVGSSGAVELITESESCELPNRGFYWVHTFNKHGKTPFSYYSPPVDTIMAAENVLYSGIIVDYVDDPNDTSEPVGITWVGTTYWDFWSGEPALDRNPMLFKVNLFDNGPADQVQWKLFDMNYQNSGYYDLPFTGLYSEFTNQELEAPAGTRSYKVYTITVIGGNSIDIETRPSLLALGENDVNNVYQTQPLPLWLSPVATTTLNVNNTRSVAWGDYDKNGLPDLATGNSMGDVKIYTNTTGVPNVGSPAVTKSAGGSIRSIAWADVEGDGYLDLAVGKPGNNKLYKNNEGTLDAGDSWSPPSEDTRSLAWGDFDRDGDQDLATGNSAQANRVFRNNGLSLENTQLWQSSDIDDTRSVAWADVDDDGDLDLIAGNYNQRNRIYYNRLTFKDGDTIRRLGSINALAWADMNNDGRLDLAIGGKDLLNPNLTSGPGGAFVYVLTNTISTPDSPIGFNEDLTNFVAVQNNGTQASLDSEAYNVAWGDFNFDGFLDLAATFPNTQQVRIYANNNGTNFLPSFTISDVEAYGVDWADFNGDGRLDLAISGDKEVPRIYFNATNNMGAQAFITSSTTTIDVFDPQHWFAGIRGVDGDNDGDIDISVVNLAGQSQLIANNAPFLSANLDAIPSIKIDREAGSVAWGDADGDGHQDLLLGGVGVYKNSGNGNTFILDFSTTESPLVFGDVDDNGELDIAGYNDAQLRVNIYKNQGGGTFAAPESTAAGSAIADAIAFGESDGDGLLDLLAVGKIGLNLPHYLFRNPGSNTAWTDLTATQFSEPYPAGDPSADVAWADFDKDSNLDFAVANFGQPVRVFQGNGDNTFDLAWSFASGFGRAVSWADYNEDGWLDLAVGYWNAPNVVYKNQNGSSFDEVWDSEEPSYTTSIAWGDWNNDGRPDLAVGNSNRPDQVYANVNNLDEAEPFSWLWASEESYNTTDLAWGDMDNDGDLDLAVSHKDGPSGVYRNSYIVASHFGIGPPLPQNPSYLYFDRPGGTDSAYLFSSTAITDVSSPVPANFRVYDPEGDNVLTDTYQYLAYGNGLSGTWETASLTSSYSGNTSRPGVPDSLQWVPPDTLVSDEIYLRLTVVHNPPAGPVQRAKTHAVSPPFRIVPVACDFPIGPSFIIIPAPPRDPAEELTFQGFLAEGSGLMQYDWNFGNGLIDSGQLAFHTYTTTNIYTVTMTVTNKPAEGESCAVRPVFSTQVITIGDIQLPPPDEPPLPPSPPVPPLTGTVSSGIYLPIILSDGSGTASTGLRTMGVSLTGGPVAGQVTGLQGSVQAGMTRLNWTARPPEEEVVGYNIYHRARQDGPGSFYLLGSVPEGIAHYTHAVACGQMYFVTAYNVNGESLPSIFSYFSPRCR